MTDPLEAIRRSVLKWCDFYSRGLPASVAEARREELDADLQDQIAWATSHEVNPGSLARQIRWRQARGAVDDLLWRRSVVRESRSESPGGWTSWTLLSTARLGGILMLTVSVYAIARTVTPYYYWSFFLAVAVPGQAPQLLAAAMALCGLVLLSRRRTRALGAAWLLVASQFTAYVSVPLLAHASVTVAALTDNTTATALLAIAASAAAIYYGGVTMWMSRRQRQELDRS